MRHQKMVEQVSAAHVKPMATTPMSGHCHDLDAICSYTPQRAHIIMILKQENGNTSQALCGLSDDRRKVYRMMNEYSIDHDRVSGGSSGESRDSGIDPAVIPFQRRRSNFHLTDDPGIDV